MATPNIEWDRGKQQGVDGKLSMPPFALPQGVMLQKLEAAESLLPRLLLTPERWKGLDVTYHPPRVERLWTQEDGIRISLHRIHPCAAEEALFHPHPWPSAMRVITGHYEMAIGYGAGEKAPPIATTLKVADGGMVYEMADPDSWHYVRPIGGVAMTVMVTGTPWNRPVPKSSEPLNPVSDVAREEIFAFFRKHYPGTDGMKPH